MKEKPLANCERDFTLQVIKQNKRLDGRRPYDYRSIKIAFGADYGCCHVEIGNTMVMAQVSCNLIEPKQTRPNEGTLMINIEFNSVACPGYEPGRLSKKGVQINRLLERCIKECKCVDLESLCVIAEKQVIIVGMNGCYNQEILTPLSSANGVLILYNQISFNGRCSIEYLTDAFKQAETDLNKTTQPVFINVDEHFMSSLFQDARSKSLSKKELGQLSDWLRSTSRVVVSICNPVQRLVRYLNKMLVLIEPTKKAVHSYVKARLDKAQSCIDVHGPEECQYMDSRDDDLYSQLLQGIYSPYIAKLQEHIPQKLVWEVRVDVKVLNHSGNVLDACSLAAISALAHFKRPDVSVDDGKITIHPPDEKAYIPLSVHHMPICSSFSFYHSGNYLLMDASYEEERVMEGQMIIAMNKHREICALHMSGTHLVHKEQVSRCTNIAASKVVTFTELIQKALQNDKESRDRGNGPGSAELNTHSRMDKLSKQMEAGIKLKPDAEKVLSSDEEEGGDSEQEVGDGSGGEDVEDITDEHWESERSKAKLTTEKEEEKEEVPVDIGSGGLSSWNIDLPDDNGDHISEQTKIIARKRKRGGKKVKSRPEPRQQSDSEEEGIIVLQTPG